MYRIVFALFAFLAFSCINPGRHKLSEQGNEIRNMGILARPDSNISDLSFLATDISYLPLETTADNKIAVIEKLIPRGKFFFVSTANNIFCFDSVGHYITKLFEYLKNEKILSQPIFDFDVDLKGEKLVILLSKEIQVFSISDTQFVLERSIRTGDFSPSEINYVPQTNDILLSFARIHGGEYTYHLIINTDKKILWFKPNYTKTYKTIQSRFKGDIIKYLFNDKLFFKEGLNDTIFVLQNNPLRHSPAFILRSPLPSLKPGEQNMQQNYPVLFSISESSRYIYYTYNYTYNISKPIWVFFDKTENKKYEVDASFDGLRDNIVGGPCFNPKILTDKYMYSWISPKELKDSLRNMKIGDNEIQYHQKHERLKKLVSSLKERDNPLLITVRLKN